MTFLNDLGFDQDAIIREVEAAKVQQETNRQICICGHAAKAHTSHSSADSMVHSGFKRQGVEHCFPFKQSCPCTEFRAVAVTGDTRNFVYKTSGPYAEHALFKGIGSSLSKGKEIKPIPETGWVCDSCEGKNQVGPVALLDNKSVANTSTSHNFLLCADCYQKALRNELFRAAVDEI